MQKTEMRGYLLLLSTLAISLVTLVTSEDNPKPCRIQSEGNQLRCVIPNGFRVRSGDCIGNDIEVLYRDHTTLMECAALCSDYPGCQAFVFHNNHRCYPKTKTCSSTNTNKLLDVVYDKVPSGYSMRQGDCPDNEILYLEKDGLTRKECAELCDSDPTCHAFLHHNNLACKPKTKGCGVPSLHSDGLNIFYDKVPRGYSLRGGDCPGNDILVDNRWLSLSQCAQLCDKDPNCISFTHFDGSKCFPKTKTCATLIEFDNRHVSYDKVPSGYAMRIGDCPGNDIWPIYEKSTTLEDCAKRCNEHHDCVSFLFKDGHECFPKTKTCQTSYIMDPFHFFYDKIVTM